MRIISGSLGGRTILSPPSDKTRPITDRAKQSLFDTLAVTLDLINATILDCFSGTGSMGIESLSRGAAKCFFVERDRGALTNLRKNLDTLNLKPQCVVLPIDAYKVAANPAFATEKLRVAFVDPPYSHVATGFERHKVDALIRELAEKCLEPDGLISLRHPSSVSVDGAAMGVSILREMKYGDMGITLLRRAPMTTLLIPFNLPLPDLLDAWLWLLGEDAPARFTTAQLSAMGDLFLTDSSTHSIHFLDTLSGTCEKIAPSPTLFNSLLQDENFQRRTLFDFLVQEMISNGVHLPPNHCYSFKTPIILGGFADAENTEVVPLAHHFSILGQLHQQLRNVPPDREVIDTRIAKGKVILQTRKRPEP